MIKALTVAAVLIAATPAMACTSPSRWGGLEEQLYEQCRAMEQANRIAEETQRAIERQACEARVAAAHASGNLTTEFCY